ncbi:RND transporter [Anaeromyxobacter paludicola]|uniref:RND transporter n=1 Tax=Anaeromyxobacter paludicola TaxID=2918171 RepID=A0ABN6NAW1_9BACT|nr:RND transporter [Anaeromyxobacter paludicola]
MLLTLSLSLLLGAAPVCGPVDLDGALALAARNGDEVAIRRAELRAAEADQSIARAARILPSASLTFLGGPVPEAKGTILHPETSTNRTLDGLGPFVRFELQVVQPLYTWGRLDAARDAADAGVRARELLVTDKVAELQQRVVQLYWGEAAARKLLAIGDDVEKNLSQVEKQLADALEAGDASVKQADRYRLDLYKAQLRKRRAEASRGLALAHDGLAATAAMLPEELVLKDAPLPLDPGPAPTMEEARAAAVQHRPDLLALEQGLLAKDAELDAAYGAMKPQLFLGGSFTFAYAPNRSPQFNPWAYDPFNTVGGGVALGVKQDLAFPLLTAQARKVRAERETLRRQREGLMRLVTVQVESAVADVVQARERLSAARAALSSGKSWFRSAGLDFEAGVAEPKELLDAYAGYVETQVEQVQAAYDLLVARAKLDQVAGVSPRKGTDPCPSR